MNERPELPMKNGGGFHPGLLLLTGWRLPMYALVITTDT